MLILAPTAKDNRDGASISNCISDRITAFRLGNIQSLYDSAMAVKSWKTPSDRPARPNNRAAQTAANSDNYRVAIQRILHNLGVARVSDNNLRQVQELFPPPLPRQNPQAPSRPAAQVYNLPGDICRTIKTANRETGAGLRSESMDSFIDLVKTDDDAINASIRELFDIIYQGRVPADARHLIADAYLALLYKDPNNLRKKRPIGIPAAMRRLLGTHIQRQSRPRFARDMLPFQFAVGIRDGGAFITTTMQLLTEKYIIGPESRGELPSRADVLLDLVNMFNNISREELLAIIEARYPELVPLADMLYSDAGSVYYRHEDGTWRIISMFEGVNQGCPLSVIFASLVLNAVLRPLQEKLNARAAARLLDNDEGDDGQGSITHIFANVDDTSASVPLVDLKFFFDELEALGVPRGCFNNREKTKIMPTCSGESIIPRLNNINPALAEEVHATITAHSAGESKDGCCLLGRPIGSQDFAIEFLEKKADEVRDAVNTVLANLPDPHTCLRLYTQCLLQKLPHLLGPEVMHTCPAEFPVDEWKKWSGPFTEKIEDMSDSFIANLLSQHNLPRHSTLISEVGAAQGGLGMLSPRRRAVPDFILSMVQAYRYATHGIHLHRDLAPVRLHPSLADLYSKESNPDLPSLCRFHQLLPTIASIASPARCPPNERVDHFLTSISPNSARGRIKAHCSNFARAELYQHVKDHCPDNFHSLPSLLSPHMSTPLIGMCRSVPSNRLSPWQFTFAMLRKLRLPVFDENNLPSCKCGATHDKYGDHAFCCRPNNKTAAHHHIRDGLLTALQPALAEAGHILPTSKLEKEVPGLSRLDPGAKPLDIAFRPDPNPAPDAPEICPFPIVGGDVTITSPVPPSDFSHSADAIEFVSAAADVHLQTKEKLKLERRNKYDGVTDEVTTGEDVIGELIDKNIVLIPMAIDPHGRLGPMFKGFLYDTVPPQPPPLQACKHNAIRMYNIATTYPCPRGIVTTACINWKRNKRRKFFGHSYTAPTPKEYTMQQIGLTITKAFALHLRKANGSDKMRNPSVVVVQPPPGFEHLYSHSTHDGTSTQ